MADSVSTRGLQASQTIMRVDLDLSFAALDNQYNAINNPDGVFPLSIAENKLNWEELKYKFKSIATEHELDDWVLGYTSPLGHPSFREAVSAFYEAYLTHCPIDPDTLACAPGATGIVEMTSFLLADQGDVAVVPAPCYPVYRQDMKNMSDVDRHDIVTHETLDELQHGPLLNLEHLQKAKQKIESDGKQFKILILTSPDNPTGLRYSTQHLSEIAQWCIANQVHCVVNEIYALSLIDITHPDIQQDYKEEDSCSSFAQLMMRLKSDYLHHWYSFSKDFGISGFRVGIIHSHNELFIKGFENYNLSHSVSNHTQWLLMHMIQDSAFLDSYISENQKRLTRSYVSVVKLLQKYNIPYVPSRGGLFVWADFSKYLAHDDQSSEMAFWMKIYESTGLLFTPGQGFGHLGHGRFRIVYPYISFENLQEALSRFDNFLSGLS